MTTGGAEAGGNGDTGGAGTGGAAGEGGAGTGGLAGCTPPVAIPGTQVVYDLPAAQAATSDTLDFFDFPWPELRRSVSELVNFPNPATATGCAFTAGEPVLELLLGAIDPIEYRGYLTAMAAEFLTGNVNSGQVVLRFDLPIDVASLPSPQLSLDPAMSPILLVNVDPAPSTRGRIVPIATRVLDGSRYAHPNTLSILPYPGFALEPGRLYAAIVKRSLEDAVGASLGSPASFEALKATGDCAPDATYRDAFDFLEAEFTLLRGDIAMMSLFRAGEPQALLEERIAAVGAVRDPASLGAPVVTGATLGGSGNYYLVSGAFESLNLQEGTPPYLPGIDIGLDGSVHVTFDPTRTEGRLLTGPLPSAAGGSDTSQPRTETLEFELAVPASLAADEVALANLPVVIYATGTGGTIESPFVSGVAEALALRGIATFSTTPVMHAARAHAENIDSTLRGRLQLADLMGGTNYDARLVATVESGQLFMNPLDLMAARGNSEQAAVDYAWQARVLSGAALGVSLGGAAVTLGFAPDKIGFFGHSQGAATGPLLATAESVSAQVLSAPSGHLITNLVGKTLPRDSLDLGAMLAYVACDVEPLDVHHPLLNVLQLWFEEVDAVNHAPRLTFEAPAAAKHVFVIAGTEDHYVSPLAHDALTSAARLEQLETALAPVVGQELLALLLPGAGYGVTYPTLEGNLAGPATGAFRQYHDATCADDHFVSTCHSEAEADWENFFATWSTGIPALP